jgi:hypothetical protein
LLDTLTTPRRTPWSEALDRPALAAQRLSRRSFATLASAGAAILALALLMRMSELLLGSQYAGHRLAFLPIGLAAFLEAIVLAGATFLVLGTWLQTEAAPGLVIAAWAVGLQTAATVVCCFVPMFALVVLSMRDAPYPPVLSSMLGVIALLAYGTVVSRVVRTVDGSPRMSALAGLHTFLLVAVFAVRCFIHTVRVWN